MANRTIQLCITCFLMILLQSSCAMKKYKVDKLPEIQLIFGNGGGFTGIETGYTLLDNGQIFKKASLTEVYTELDKSKKKTAKSLFEQASLLIKPDSSINNPGNVYHFIHLKNEDIDHKITWGHHEYQLDSDIQELYYNLVELVKIKK